ncbi:hypothetical protein AX774_g8189 [Zancudomyces culisetae]|uniref:Pre-rRNA-processing protein Ipi1 N-terminal domain-containing protein n=1 Tax=Zancudomyces culisetae TaxID=1213189 RepID=A0A1R1PBT5_ZANCU|nr:hypothetical protein AX774_g8189 [Zancudomyces culisetae]|eukprot:OMH78428.1 hypothetical protein AX774_g8189 [Zancudomyces culisetae]
MAYVLLGMSHISEDIREESLKIMNVMIKYQPDAMASFSEKILPNFYTLLSTQSKSANPNSGKYIDFHPPPFSPSPFLSLSIKY